MVKIDPSGKTCVPTCCCCASDIVVSSIRPVFGERLSPPPPDDGIYQRDFFGHSFTVTPVWSNLAKGTPPPAKMPKCGWTWEEKATSPTVNGFPNDSVYSVSPGPKPSVQDRITWRCRWRLCATGQCPIWDAPGSGGPYLEILRSRAKRLNRDVPLDVCIRWSLTSSCAPSDCFYRSLFVEALFRVTIRPSGQILLFHQIFPPTTSPTNRCAVRKEVK